MTKKTSPEDLLDSVLVKTLEVEKELALAKDELAVAHAVLETKVAPTSDDADVQGAVVTTSVVHQRIGKSAEDLAEVKSALSTSTKKETDAQNSVS